MTRYLPIVRDGALVPDALCLLEGFMFYPNDRRAAEQLAAILKNEAQAPDKDPSPLLKTVLTRGPDSGILCLVGEMALFVAESIHRDGKAYVERAAHFAREEHRSDRRGDGRSLPASQSSTRRKFNEYAPVLHLWGACQYLRLTQTEVEITEMLSLAIMICEVLKRADFAFEFNPWIIAPFTGMQVYSWPSAGLIENPEALIEHMKTYKSR